MPPDQLESFKADLKEWLVNYPLSPGHQLPFADLRGIGFNFSFLQKGFEVIDSHLTMSKIEVSMSTKRANVMAGWASIVANVCLSPHYPQHLIVRS